jgi:uncharacterized protein YaaQ
MITAVIQEDDCSALVDTLLDSGFHATKVASTGGFLHRGNVTLLIGAEDGDVALLLDLVRKNCTARQVDSVVVGGAVVFVQDIEQYHRL